MPFLDAGEMLHAAAAGNAAIVPPDTPHSVRPMGHCRVVIADYPVRTELPGISH